MTIPIKNSDRLVINLDSADDRMEVYVNGHLVDSLDVGQPGKTHNLLADFSPGLNTVKVAGIDKQIPHRSVSYRVVKVTESPGQPKSEVIVWQDHKEETNGPGDASPHGVWYESANEFQLG
jgi:hypothetical protein